MLSFSQFVFMFNLFFQRVFIHFVLVLLSDTVYLSLALLSYLEQFLFNLLFLHKNFLVTGAKLIQNDTNFIKF